MVSHMSMSDFPLAEQSKEPSSYLQFLGYSPLGSFSSKVKRTADAPEFFHTFYIDRNAFSNHIYPEQLLSKITQAAKKQMKNKIYSGTLQKEYPDFELISNADFAESLRLGLEQVFLSQLRLPGASYTNSGKSTLITDTFYSSIAGFPFNDVLDPHLNRPALINYEKTPGVIKPYEGFVDKLSKDYVRLSSSRGYRTFSFSKIKKVYVNQDSRAIRRMQKFLKVVFTLDFAKNAKRGTWIVTLAELD